jgi:rRNA-processing protein FCF1
MILKYLIDENCKVSPIDIRLLKECDIINSADIFRIGEKDEILTKRAKKERWVIVTQDIRMALRSLKDGVGVIFIDEDGVNYLTVEKHDIKEFKEMHDYLYNRFVK